MVTLQIALIILVLNFTHSLENLKNIRKTVFGYKETDRFYEVDIGLPSNTRILAYSDINSDTK